MRQFGELLSNPPSDVQWAYQLGYETGYGDVPARMTERLSEVCKERDEARATITKLIEQRDEARKERDRAVAQGDAARRELRNAEATIDDVLKAARSGSD